MPPSGGLSSALDGTVRGPRGAETRPGQEISDGRAEEKQFGIIKPDVVGAKVGTWRAVVDLGDTAEKLLGDAVTPGPMKYIHTGVFDRGAFSHAYERAFKDSPPHTLFDLLRMMEVD